MVKIFVYLLLVGSVLYALSFVGKGQRFQFPQPPEKPLGRKGLRAKRNPREVWIQVYETAALAEARALQARLQEEEIECVVYEQGKKDIYGNELTGIGIAVPKSFTRLAQGLISRMSG